MLSRVAQSDISASGWAEILGAAGPALVCRGYLVQGRSRDGFVPTARKISWLGGVRQSVASQPSGQMQKRLAGHKLFDFLAAYGGLL